MKRKMTELKTKTTLKLQLGRSHEQYEFGRREAKWRKRDGFQAGLEPAEYFVGLCKTEFEKMTGLALKRGEVRNVTITIRLETP